MSDWKSRAIPVAENGSAQPPSDWRARATPVESGFLDKAKDVGLTGLDAASRALDYGGGIARLAGAGVANIPYSIATGESLTKPDDWFSAIKGKAPSTADYLERAHVPKGYELSDAIPGLYSQTGDELLKLKKGGMLDPSARGVAGFVGDVALDPLTYLTLGQNQAIKQGIKTAAEGGAKASLLDTIKDLPTAASRATADTGRDIYKSAFKREGAKVYAKTGQSLDPILNDMFDQGVTGFRGKFEKFGGNRTEELLKDRSLLLNGLDNGTVDMYEATEPALRKLNRAVDEKRLTKEQAKGAQDWLDALRTDAPSYNLTEGSNMKTNLYDQLPQNAYDGLGRALPAFDMAQKDVARGLKESVKKGAESQAAGAGQELDQINELLGGYRQFQKPLRQEIAKEMGKDGVTQVKSGLFAMDPAAAIAAYGAQALNAVPVRTNVGRRMFNLGVTGVPDLLMRQGLINSQRPNPYDGLLSKP